MARPIRQPSPDELDGALLDRVLEPGDCLAIPRGLPHAAETMDAESAHLTIGIMALTWNRVLRDLIDDMAAGSALADRLPFGGLGGLDGADRPRPTTALDRARRPDSPTTESATPSPPRCGGASRRPVCARASRWRSTSSSEWR